MQNYEAYLFDWDGTLARTVHIWVGVAKRHLADYGISVTEAQVAALYGNFEMPVLLGLPAELNSKFHDEIVPIAEKELRTATLYDDAREVLEKLKSAGKKLALISNSRRESVDTVLQRFGLEKFFDAIISQDDVAKHKPDPTGLLLAMERLNVLPAKALALGDTASDIEAATNAHVDSLLFSPPENQKLYDFEEYRALHPTYLIHGWHELSDEF